MSPAVIRYAFLIFAIGLALWVARGMLAPMAWAAVIAISSWPIFKRFCHLFRASSRNALAAAFTCMMAVALVLPIAYAAVALADVAPAVTGYAARLSAGGGFQPPEFLAELPIVGSWITEQWTHTLGRPDGLIAVIERLQLDAYLGAVANIGLRAADGVTTFLITLFTLFFLYRDGELVASEIQRIGNLYIGRQWSTYVACTNSATHAVMNGMVLLGIVEGVLLGASYWLVGLPSPLLIATIIGAATVLPGISILLHVGLCAFVAIDNSSIAAAGLLVWGLVVLGVFDSIARPALIGGTTKIPFFWVMVGIIGGVNTFGLLGLFLGPIVIAVMLEVWRASKAAAVNGRPATTSVSPIREING